MQLPRKTWDCLERPGTNRQHVSMPHSEQWFLDWVVGDVEMYAITVYSKRHTRYSVHALILTYAEIFDYVEHCEHILCHISMRGGSQKMFWLFQWVMGSESFRASNIEKLVRARALSL